MAMENFYTTIFKAVKDRAVSPRIPVGVHVELLPMATQMSLKLNISVGAINTTYIPLLK